MSELKLEFVGKKVKDMYGTHIGKVVGLVTDIDGSIESVGVDCGSVGLKQLPYEQLLVQGDYVIYIPRWRMDAQKLVRQKSLTLKRIKALQDLVADNDQMKSDAEIVYLKYENRLRALEGEEHGVINTLKSRLEELDSQAASIKTVVFDAKLQYRSNDMTEETYQQVNMNANELLEHINLEKEEISNFLTRISQHTVDDIELTSELEVQDDKYDHTADTNSNKYVRQEDNMDLENGRLLATSTADKDGPKEESAVAIGSDSDSEVNWLNEVIAKEIKDDQ
ncbi:MAG TPA: CdvA-like protein [Nitrososphaeraceae archaeon]|nr:CdvA-like protein [Nitrososphaeraceae archaeon]